MTAVTGLAAGGPVKSRPFPKRVPGLGGLVRGCLRQTLGQVAPEQRVARRTAVLRWAVVKLVLA